MPTNFFTENNSQKPASNQDGKLSVKVENSTLDGIIKEAKCFMVMGSHEGALDIENVLEGGENQHYKTLGSDALPDYFKSISPLFINIQNAASQSRFRGGAHPNSTYIFSIGYTMEEIIHLAAKGNFSLGILSAVNAKEFGLAGGFTEAYKTADYSKLNVILNKNFNPNLILNQEKPHKPTRPNFNCTIS